MKQKLLLLSSLLLVGLSSHAQIQFTKSTIDSNTSTKPYAVAASDLTGNGNTDLAIGTYNGSKVAWYKNNGDETFSSGVILEATDTAALSFIESIAIADLNNDGFNDIIATGGGSNNLVWFQNNGDETFQPAQLISSEIDGAGAVKVANIDNDPNGNLDIIVSGYYLDAIVYFLGNGDGTFGPMKILAQEAANSGPGSFDIADFDGDGDLDVVVGYTSGGFIKLYDNKLVQDGLDTSGDVPFEPYTTTVDSDNGWLWSVIFADVNNDGNLNIVKSDSEPTTGNATLAWYSNDTTGIETTFTETVVPTSFSHGGAVNVADINNNGYNDLILGNSYSSGVDLIVFEGNEDGSLGEELILDDTTGSIFSMALADFNNDEKLDIATISYLLNDLTVFFNNTTLSTPSFETTEIVLFPNPVKNTLYLKSNKTEDAKVSVYNILGEKVFNSTLSAIHGLDVSNLSNGVYFIKLDNNKSTFKFVKQ